MAKSSKTRKTEKENYKEMRSKIVRATREVRKAGYELQFDLPTVRQVEHENVKGEFARLNRTLRKYAKNLKSLPVYSTETGEAQTLAEARKTIKEASVEPMLTDIVREWIDSIPDYRDMYIKAKGHRRGDHIRKDFTNLKEKLRNAISSNIQDYGAVDYERYLRRNEDQIMSHIETIIYDSDNQAIDYSMTALVNIITANYVDFETQSEINELTSEYNEEANL